jgi:hypothetical protein
MSSVYLDTSTDDRISPASVGLYEYFTEHISSVVAQTGVISLTNASETNIHAF